MADDQLEPFEELTGGGGGGAEDAGGAFDSDLDDLFGGGDDSVGGGMGDDAPMGDEGGGSSLDTFFEDLSTIDDLEVLQDEGGDDEAAAAEPDIEVGGPEVSEPEEEAPPEKEEKKEKKPRKKREGPGFFSRWFKRLIVLAILGVGGYFGYQFLVPKVPEYWKVVPEGVEEAKKVFWSYYDQYTKGDGEKMPPKEVKPPAEPDGKPPALIPLPQEPKPRARPRRPARVAKPAPRPQRERGPYSIQVATCFFPSCLKGYTSYLKANKRSVLVQQRSARKQSLEVFSVSSFTNREDAQDIAVRINRSHPLEGHAYSYRENNAYRISMGAFDDLRRAKAVKASLNRQFAGQIVFSTRAKDFPYKMKKVMTGKYPSRRAANKALAALKLQEPRFKDAFVVRRR